MSDLDISDTILAKSDQLNAIDISTGDLAIEITGVSKPGGEQPVIINYAGGEGKPYKPGKSMRRVMQKVWGSNMGKYIGQKLLLHCDGKVMYAGLATGGIRIKAMSGISNPVTVVLQASKGKFIPYTVQPMPGAVLKVVAPDDLMKQAADAANAGTESLKKFWSALNPAQQKQLSLPVLKQAAADMDIKNNKPEGE